MQSMRDNPFRNLPAVHQVLDHPFLCQIKERHAHVALLDAIRVEIAELREKIKPQESGNLPIDLDALAGRVRTRLENSTVPLLRSVINATGIVLHTNLGRSPLAEAAARAAYDAGRGYLNLELDLATGKRSSRQDPIRDVLARLTGAESATAVNNCAAATLIVLRALASGREVIVSRGQLIEIGGSFRIPEIMTVSGATLREVGTTNITRIGDYEKAIGPNTALLMRIHPSNYRIRGFTQAVELAELVELGRKHNLPVIDDVGSGALLDFAEFGLPGEPVASESITAGADLVLCSGDKLLGGPQAGLIIGRRSLVERIEKDPLMRAVRIDKMMLAALEATLRLHLHPERARKEVPTLRMIALTPSELQPRAEALAAKLTSISGIASVQVREETSFVGGGSLPDQPLPSVVVAVTAEGMSEEAFASRLRIGHPAVLARIQDGQVLFDLRTVFEEQEADLREAIAEALKKE
ncbi:MAG: L-seryl-tRNA(Sec) selenium transferase [Planctomycetes bacterium]|nr:L-seryl-tRNA(Sec) selenium transferase [Planctomycetota bacterium]